METGLESCAESEFIDRTCPCSSSPDDLHILGTSQTRQPRPGRLEGSRLLETDSRPARRRLRWREKFEKTEVEEGITLTSRSVAGDPLRS